MPPSSSAVLASIEQIIAQNPSRIHGEHNLSILVMRELRSTTAYISGVIDDLIDDGSLKRIWVDPAGYLSLTGEDRLDGGLTLIYLQPRDYGEPVYGEPTLKRINRGHLWSGEKRHAYVTTQTAWAALRESLTAKLATGRAARKAKSDERRQQEQALIESSIPDYPKAMETLAELLPGVTFKVMPFATEKDDPRIHVDVEGLLMSDLKRIVDLILKDASTP